MNATIFILPVPFVSDKALRPRKAQMVNFVFALMGNTTEVVALSWNPAISKKSAKKKKNLIKLHSPPAIGIVVLACTRR